MCGVKDVRKTTIQIRPGFTKDAFCLPLIQEAALKNLREHQRIEKLWEGLLNKDGLGKPTTPTKES